MTSEKSFSSQLDSANLHSSSMFDISITRLNTELRTVHDPPPSTWALHELVDCGHLRYHVLISYTRGTSAGIEGDLIRSLHLARCSRPLDVAALSKAWTNLENFWQPVVRADYISRRFSWSKKELVKLQILTISGVLQTNLHQEPDVPWPRHQPIENRWPELTVFRHPETLEGKDQRLGHRVTISGKHYHFKDLQTFFDPEYFIRSIDAHLKLEGNLRFPRLAGLTECPEGDRKIGGFVWEVMEGTFLDQLKMADVDSERRNKWKRQIQEAAIAVERQSIGWHDVCVEDILIQDSTDSGEAVVCGLGGGVIVVNRYGEVEPEAVEKVHGLEKIWGYLDGV